MVVKHGAGSDWEVLLTHAGLRWALPRLQRPRRLLVDYKAIDVAEFLPLPARWSGHHDLSNLVELQISYAGDNVLLAAIALEGMLRQASTLLV